MPTNLNLMSADRRARTVSDILSAGVSVSVRVRVTSSALALVSGLQPN